MVHAAGASPSRAIGLWDLYFRQLEQFPAQSREPGQLSPQQQTLDGLGFPPNLLLDGNGVTGAPGLDRTHFGAQTGGGIHAGQLMQSLGIQSLEQMGTQHQMLGELREMSVGELAQRLEDPTFARHLSALLSDQRMGPQILADRGLVDKIGQALLQSEIRRDPDFRAQPGSPLASAMNGDTSILSDPQMAALIAELLNKRRRDEAGGRRSSNGGAAGHARTPRIGQPGFNPTYAGPPASPPAHSPTAGPRGTDNGMGPLPRSADAGRGGANQIQLDVPNISQFDGSRVERAGDAACYRAARAIAATQGVHIPAGTAGNKIQVATSENSVGQVSVDRQGLAEARHYIDSQLQQGRPVVAGVSHKDASYNSDGLTDHFVVITGRGVDANGQTYYTYNDPAVGHGNEADGLNRRFYVDPENGNLIQRGNVAAGRVADRHTEMSMVIRSN